MILPDNMMSYELHTNTNWRKVMTKATTPGQTLLRWQFAHPQPKPTEKKVKLINSPTLSDCENMQGLTKNTNPK